MKQNPSTPAIQINSADPGIWFTKCGFILFLQNNKDYQKVSQRNRWFCWVIFFFVSFLERNTFSHCLCSTPSNKSKTTEVQPSVAGGKEETRSRFFSDHNNNRDLLTEAGWGKKSKLAVSSAQKGLDCFAGLSNTHTHCALNLFVVLQECNIIYVFKKKTVL